MSCNKQIQRAQQGLFHLLEPYRSLPMIFAEVNRVYHLGPHRTTEGDHFEGSSRMLKMKVCHVPCDSSVTWNVLLSSPV